MSEPRLECGQLEDALLAEDPAKKQLVREHALECPECRAAVLAWDQIATLAPSLRRSWESPELAARITRALAHQAPARPVRPVVPMWRYGLLAASLILALGLGITLYRTRSTGAPVNEAEAERQLLTERAMAAVERSEADYIGSIEGLAKLAEPMIERPETPLLASYREKLQILDAAIAECRAQIERNRFNTHLRRELLSVYQEKQRTLEKLMQEKS